MELHRERDCVQYDREEYRVLEPGAVDKPPDLILDDILGYIPLHRPRLQRELNTLSLVLVEIAVLELVLTLVLKCDNDETDENVDHEEGDHDNIADEEDGHGSPVVVDRAFVLSRRVDRLVEQGRPALEGGHCEERLHPVEHVVEVELVVAPLAVLDGQLAALVLVEGAVALGLVEHGQVSAVVEGALEELDAYAGEHELEEEGDDEDVADGLHGHDQTVDDVLQAFGSVDGAQGT